MRVLLISSAEKGHLNPMVGVAQWLMRDGHHVGWLTVPEPAPQLRALGVEVVTLPGGPPAPPLVTGGAALARLVLDERALGDWIRRLLLDAVPGQIEPARRAMRGFQPDVVALDGMVYQGVLAAHLEGLPWAGISSALTLLEPPEVDSALMRTLRGLAEQRRALFARHGLVADFRTCECLSPRLNVVFASEALVGSDARVPPATVLAGPSIPPAARGDEPSFPWDRLRDDRPLVYLSFGSQISWQPEIQRLFAEAAAPLGVQLVMSAGELADTELPASLPGDVVVVPYAPQLALLARAAVLISHGGANSVMESLQHGVPIVQVPICNDQFVQAHFLTKAGAGVILDRRQLTVEACRQALRRALDPEADLTRNARRIRDDYRLQDGARTAARLIAGLGP